MQAMKRRAVIFILSIAMGVTASSSGAVVTRASPSHGLRIGSILRGSIYTVHITTTYHATWGPYVERGTLSALGRTYPLFGWVTAIADFNQVEFNVFAPPAKLPSERVTWPIGGVMFENRCTPSCAVSQTWVLKPIWGRPLANDKGNKTIVLTYK
jgi:hypothetical protein